MNKLLAEILGDNIVVGEWKPGTMTQLKPDILVTHDIAFPSAIRTFAMFGGEKVKNPGNIYLIHDHLQPAKDIASANLAKKGLEFAKEQDIKHIYTAGEAGILTVALDELTTLKPGMLIAGTDTHMPTYGAFGIVALCISPIDMAHVMRTGTFWFEPPLTVRIRLRGELKPFVGGRDIGLWLLKNIGMDGGIGKFFILEGDVVDNLRICGRRQLCNLMVEAGAVGAFMKADAVVAEYLGFDESELPDIGKYECDESLSFNLDDIEPQVALPGRTDDVHPVGEIEDTDVDAVFIGSCAGGSLEDLEALDEIMKERSVCEDVRLIVIPQSAGTFVAAERQGIIGRIVTKGAYVSGPGCGPCMGAQLGVLGRGEVCVSTSPRNFPGRMGSIGAKIYLANAHVAAAAAVTGKIVHPGSLNG